MPRIIVRTPKSLEDQCLRVYYDYLSDEMNLLFYLSFFKEKSILLRTYCRPVDSLFMSLEIELSRLRGLLRDMVLKKMVDLVIGSLHHICSENSPFLPSPGGGAPLPDATATTSNGLPPNNTAKERQLRRLPAFKLLELLLNPETAVLDFSINKDWPENDRIEEIARCLWKLIGEKCPHLEKLVIPKELCYSNSLNAVIAQGSCLKYLTLKRNVPTNLCLNLIGQSCPNLVELDIAGADIVTDFGVICLLFEDPEQIFTECWDREKTVGSSRKCQRAFPHPHFDKPIPDPSESSTSLPAPSSSHIHHHSSRSPPQQFLYLKKSFYEVIKNPALELRRLPLCESLKKLRLENTRVKGDGASVIIDCCPRVLSLGYLVFASAGLKQVFGYDERFNTKFTEIFYRGPSDQKLQTIGNVCPLLNTMFLGSNSLRRLHAGVFSNWKRLEYLTLENIVVEDVVSCLHVVGGQLKGLKIQCRGMDLSDIALHCRNLTYLIIQNETPVLVNTSQLPPSEKSLFPALKELEISCLGLSKACLGFLIRSSVRLRSLKVLEVNDLCKADLEAWVGCLGFLETLVIFRSPELNRETLDFVIESLPRLSIFGNLKSFDIKASDISKIMNRIKDEDWDLHLIISDSHFGVDEKEFSKLLSLHWFYLTPNRVK